MIKTITPTTFIDPFVDFSFKRLFSSEQSKPILIGLLNHLFKGRKYITEVETLMFIELLNFVKEPHELHNQLDKWIFALKHLAEFEQRPEYLNGPEFDQLFNLAEYANLTREERDMYNTSLKYKWDNKNVRDYEVSKGREEGREEGKAEGIAEGKHKKAIEMAIKLKAKNMLINEIIELTGLSAEEIETLE